MKSFKKVATLTLFLSLIASFVLYKADVFTFEKTEDTSKLIVSDFATQKDSLDKDRRLLIDYIFHLDIDRSNLTVEKRLVKTFTLETWDTQLISSSKSFIVQRNKERPKFVSKNDSITKKFDDLKIKRVRFTTNKHLDGIAREADLLEVIKLIENKVLKSNSSLEQHIKDQDIVNLFWGKFKNNEIEVNNSNSPNGVFVNKEKVNNFLKWYSRLEAKRRADEKKRMEMMSSSKVIIVADLNEIGKPKPEFLEEKKLFEQKLKEYLDIKF